MDYYENKAKELYGVNWQYINGERISLYRELVCAETPTVMMQLYDIIDPPKTLTLFDIRLWRAERDRYYTIFNITQKVKDVITKIELFAIMYQYNVLTDKDWRRELKKLE